MSFASMTGFAESAGAQGDLRWRWESQERQWQEPGFAPAHSAGL